MATVVSSPIARADGPAEYRLRAAPSSTHLIGSSDAMTDVLAYNGAVSGPVLRLKQGEPVRMIIDNGLDQDTTVHWHGIRVPNAMDGVPGLTQPPIKAGESFVYEFTPPDAGTFWYHPHANSLQQIGRGLAGALIVEEREPVSADRDLVWVLQDWRLTDDGQIAGGFTETGFIHTGVDAHGLNVSRDGKFLYVANRSSKFMPDRPRGNGSVSVVEFAINKVVATWTIPGGGSPNMGNVTPDGKELWLAGRFDG
jgi:FtsP/CotA-like multicopper oxidase with cupredoxin domain